MLRRRAAAAAALLVLLAAHVQSIHASNRVVDTVPGLRAALQDPDVDTVVISSLLTLGGRDWQPVEVARDVVVTGMSPGDGLDLAHGSGTLIHIGCATDPLLLRARM